MSTHTATGADRLRADDGRPEAPATPGMKSVGGVAGSMTARVPPSPSATS